MGAKKAKPKRSAKATAQQADRAYAEFEKLTRHVKPARPTTDTEPVETNGERPKA